MNKRHIAPDDHTTHGDPGSLDHPAGDELQRYLDGTLNTQAADVIVEHLATCVLCMQSAMELSTVHEDWDNETEPPAKIPKVTPATAAISTPVRLPRPEALPVAMRRRATAPWMAMAAAALLAVAVGYWLLGSPTRLPGNPVSDIVVHLTLQAASTLANGASDEPLPIEANGTGVVRIEAALNVEAPATAYAVTVRAVGRERNDDVFSENVTPRERALVIRVPKRSLEPGIRYDVRAVDAGDPDATLLSGSFIFVRRPS